jgi:hypothetical protein
MKNIGLSKLCIKILFDDNDYDNIEYLLNEKYKYKFGDIRPCYNTKMI